MRTQMVRQILCAQTLQLLGAQQAHDGPHALRSHLRHIHRELPLRLGAAIGATRAGTGGHAYQAQPGRGSEIDT